MVYLTPDSMRKTSTDEIMNRLRSRTTWMLNEEALKALRAKEAIQNKSKTEKEVIDFYMTTENGVVSSKMCMNYSDRLTQTCKDEIISFIDDFKLCS